jgi:hypothetical protein
MFLTVSLTPVLPIQTIDELEFNRVGAASKLHSIKPSIVSE